MKLTLHTTRRCRVIPWAVMLLLALPAARTLNLDDRTLARCWVEGAELALAKIGELKTDKKEKKEYPMQGKFLADGPRATDLRKGLTEAQVYVAGCLFARHLVNLPPNILTPVAMAARARRMAKAEGMTCRILNVAQMKKLNMGGILGVGQGSRQEPRLIHLEYRAPGAAGARAPRIALVGKGITFDTGGISLKPGAGTRVTIESGFLRLAQEGTNADLIVDAILGTGLSGPVRGFYIQVIEQINSQSKPFGISQFRQIVIESFSPDIAKIEKCDP